MRFAWAFFFNLLFVSLSLASEPMTWNLQNDFGIAPHQSNPDPDQYGNPAVWHYLIGPTVHSPSAYTHLPTFIPNSFGILGLEEWVGSSPSTGDFLPNVGVNATGTNQNPRGILWGAGKIRLHPLPNQNVIVGWESPIDGTVDFSGAFTKIDPNCGNGIKWSVYVGTILNASGTVPVSGSESFQGTAVSVAKQDFIYFVLDANGGNHQCDSTELDVVIHGSNSSSLSPKIVLNDGTGAEVPSGTILSVSPSVYEGLCSGIPADVPQRKNFGVFCVDPHSGEPVDGCHYQVVLKGGKNTGGHDHDRGSSAPRPLGLLLPELAGVSPQTVSIQGSPFVYEATEIAQDVDFEVLGFGPDGASIPGVKGTFRISDPASADFQIIALNGLNMNVASHPSGVYGTSTFIAKLDRMLNYYFEHPGSADTIDTIESQGASLAWGGLFDIDQDWVSPHCGHRDGKTIDISVDTPSVQLNSREKSALSRAILRNGLAFYYAKESPSTLSANHWHVQEKKQ